MTMIDVLQLRVRAGDHEILRGIDLSVAKGELVALVGPNGAGKSTLLRALAGDLAPASGEIFLDGAPLATRTKAELARRRAVLPQHSALDFPFTALEVALLGRLPFGGPDEREIRLARRALDRAGVGSLAMRRYPTLSGGERQRVQLARVLTQLETMARPRLLLLDEPTSSLDQSHAHHLLELAEELAEDDTAVVVVLHDLHLASQHASRVVVIDGGLVVADGPPATTLVPDLVAAVFRVDAITVEHPALRAPALVTLPRPRRDRLEEAS